jgi:ABC-type sugar transport system, ATPase component
MSENMCTLEMKDISIEFPGVKALNNVNFTMRSGEIRAVVGANGAGKSTLMKVLAGANETYTGDIFIDSQHYELRTPRAAKDLGIELVYQEVDTALFPYLTVGENIMFNSIVTGMKGRAMIRWRKSTSPQGISSGSSTWTSMSPARCRVSRSRRSRWCL